MSVNFKVLKNCNSTKARLGKLKINNADVVTPIFMPVATHGAIRSQRTPEVSDLGYQILLANTYHLILRPGINFFEKFGELRKFAQWSNGFLTDSGGFQVFSLSTNRKITEQGALFRNHIDGSELLLTPELSMKAQIAFNSDIMMVLDECVASTVDKKDAARAMGITHRWAVRSLDYAKPFIKKTSQGVFGIVQGACFSDLREESAKFLSGLDFDGLAIGGLAVGETRDERESMCKLVTGFLPANKPRYLMGVGTPLDILEAVASGVDMFDCVLPTMLGQQGVAFTSFGKIDLRKSKFFEDTSPIDSECDCSTCKKYDRQFLHHLVKTYDVSAQSLIGLHNLSFYARLMTDIRTAISEDRFDSFYKQKVKDFESNLEDNDLLKNSDKDAKFDISQNTKIYRSITNDGNDYKVFERKNNEGNYVVSIMHKQSGEVMHSSMDPIVESRRLYVEQAKLIDRLSLKKETVIWDVGLGAATNASGVIECYQKIPSKISLESFEITLEPLSLVLSKKAKFPHAQHPWIEKIFTDKKISLEESSGASFNWNLYLGNFLDKINSSKDPDLIYFDPFSYKVDSDLWTFDSFKKLYVRISDLNCVAFTFSAATRVRAAMLAAGFFVAKGFSTGRKQETTVFMTKKAADTENYPLLDKAWLDKWKRSHTQFPADVGEDTKSNFIELIQGHKQFC